MKKFAILMLMLAATCTFAVGCASTGGTGYDPAGYNPGGYDPGGYDPGSGGGGACSSCSK